MFRSSALLVLVGLAASAFVRDARAEEQAGPRPRGALVVALGEGTASAAKPLAREVYRDEALRPAVDDASARVLAGDKPAEGAPEKLRELAAVRATIAAAPEDAAARRLLASLGAERQAEIVVAVSIVGARTIARVLHVEGARYEPLELVPAIEDMPGGEPRFSWPGATSALHRLTSPSIPPPVTPLVPRKADAADGTKAPQPVPPTPTPWYKSAWFWAPLGVVTAAGAAVLIASKLGADDPGSVHLTGTVAP